MMKAWTLLLVVVSVGPMGAQEKKQEPLVLRNAAGKEEKLLAWHFTTGTRKLSWLDGGSALEFRELNSTSYVEGIVTLVPLSSLKALAYDPDKKAVSATVVIAGGKEETLLGTTKFQKINHIALEGDADLGTLGAAAVKLTGGLPGGVLGLRFPSPKPGAEVKGRPALIVADDKEKTSHTVAGLVPLYFVNGAYRTLPELRFKTTVKIGLDMMTSMRRLPPVEKKQTTLEFQVTLADGAQHNLTLLSRAEVDDHKSAQLVGLVGQVPAGYKLFPPHTIAELRFEAK